ALVRAGVDVFRLNFSHGDADTHRETLRRIRAAARIASAPHVAVLQDLSAPKIRTGALEGGQPLTLAAGDRLEVVLGDHPGKSGVITTTYAPLLRAIKPGARLLLD